MAQLLSNLLTFCSVEYLHDLLLKHWNVSFYYVPDYFVVDAEVPMNKSISHSGNCPPFNLRVLPSNVLWNMLSCFPNHFDTSNKGPLQRFIIKKRLSINASPVVDQVAGFIEHMA